MRTLCLLTMLMLSSLHNRAKGQETNLKEDEQIVFYPSIAQRVPGQTNVWRAEIRGGVFEVEKWRLLIGAFRKAIEIKSDDLTAEENTFFTNRARLFLVDNERRKGVYIRLGTNSVFVGTSSANGKFSGKVTFTHTTNSDFHAIIPRGDTRHFSGRIFPLEEEGVSVISDIDDTIKVTQVLNRKAMLRNTFLREFEAVPGMAEFYQCLARSNHAAFHYISASPWQLYEPLANFTRSNGFPAGMFELKQFRWKDRSFFSLFADPEKYKPTVIEPLLRQFPKRKFILIGDSGERDPEVYGALARKFPEQVIQIYIRDVTGESTNAPRYREAFRNMPSEHWQIFREPTEIKLPSSATKK